MSELVTQLRDIHLPPEPSAWPPAPAAWLSLPFAAVVLAVVVLRRRRSRSIRGQVRRELRRIAREHRAQPEVLVAALAVLLRRGALAAFGREAAGLAGADWATFLERHAPPGCDRRAWEAIALARYTPEPPPVEPAALMATTRRWLEHVLP